MLFLNKHKSNIWAKFVFVRLSDSCEFKPSLSNSTTNIIYLTLIHVFSSFLTFFPLEASMQSFQKGNSPSHKIAIARISYYCEQRKNSSMMVLVRGEASTINHWVHLYKEMQFN
jgi:hypothetical protein